MTVSTTVNPEFQRDKIIELGIRLTGTLPLLESPRPQLIAIAADHLNMEMDSLQAAGKVLRTIERTTQALTDGVSEYTLGTNVFDIVSNANGAVGTIINSSDNSETVVMELPRGEWMSLGDKSATSPRPSFCYVERQAQVKLVFWPIPEGTGLSFRFAQVRYFFANDTGNLNPDLTRVWTKYLCYTVAAAVAATSSLGLEKVGYFEAKAKEEMKRCEAGDSEHGGLVLRVGHSGRNW